MLLFPDTNFFLQCLAPAEIPWHDVTQDDEVRLLVCRTVQGEIDHLKGDGKGRRADRARRTSSWFASIIKNGRPLRLREAGPRVVLEFASRVDRLHAHPPGLDMTRNDDRVIGEILAHAANCAILLTDDTGMMATARHEGVPFLPTPEGWRLPPEADARDRQIAELRRRLEGLERVAPTLELSTPNDGGPHTIPRTRYEQLSAAAVDELLESMVLRFPAKVDFSMEADPGYVAFERAARFGAATSFGAIGMTDWHPPTADAVMEYQTFYTLWKDAVRARLASLHSRLPGVRGTTRLSWSLSNSGTIPAEGLIVVIEALGDLWLLAPSAVPSLERTPLGLPGAPKAPVWKGVSGLDARRSSLQATLGFLAGGRSIGSSNAWTASLMRPLEYSRMPEARDAQGFYWRAKSSRTLSKRWEFECAEFRHGGVPEVFDAVVLAPYGTAIESGAVRFRASARNLPTALEQVTRVGVETTVGDIGAEAHLLVSKAWQSKDTEA